MGVTFEDVLEAYQRIKDLVHQTPVMTSQTLNEITGATLYFKCENFQKAGAFKFRGATNAVLSLPEQQAQRGVLTHSSGNHAGALSLAARMRGIPAYIVMPENAPEVKVAAVKNYGGQITFCKPTLEARENTAADLLQKTGAVLVHPYNNEKIIAGQGTAALELLREIHDLEAILTPVGGGGLLSGSALSAKGMNPSISVYGCEPRNADDAYHSFRAGRIIPVQNPNTIADGLRTSLGPIPFSIIREQVTDILLTSEEGIVKAMRYLWERMKIVVEPSGAVPLAALLENKERFSGKTVGLILSGGNVDLRRLPF